MRHKHRQWIINKIQYIIIRPFVISQIDFFISFPTYVVFKKIKGNISYGERAQLDRLECANQPSISHLNKIGKTKKLANIFLTATYCSQRVEKMYEVDDKSLWIFSDFFDVIYSLKKLTFLVTPNIIGSRKHKIASKILKKFTLVKKKC